MAKRIAVIAGTRVDTQMGVEYIMSRNEQRSDAGPDACGTILEPVYCPVSEDCDAQIRFQYSDEEFRRRSIDGIFDPEISQGTRDFFIYCNSLSGAFDFDSYASDKTQEYIQSLQLSGADDEIRIYTPLQVYRELGSRFGRVGVMAANNLSAYGIERALMSANEDLYVIGTGNMSIVRAIEDGIDPATIIERLGLVSMLRYMEACGAEAVILGCTHFPYFKKELSRYAEVPLIDPADLMYEAVLRR